MHPLCAQKPDNYCCIHHGHKSQTITVASIMGIKARQLLLHPLWAQKPDNYCCIHYGHKSQTITVASALVVTGSCFVEIQRLFKLQGQRNKEWSWVRFQLCFRLCFPRKSCWASGILVQYCSNKVNSEQRAVLAKNSKTALLGRVHIGEQFWNFIDFNENIFVCNFKKLIHYIFSICLFKRTVNVHSFFVDPAVLLNADPDPDPAA